MFIFSIVCCDFLLTLIEYLRIDEKWTESIRTFFLVLRETNCDGQLRLFPCSFNYLREKYLTSYIWVMFIVFLVYIFVLYVIGGYTTKIFLFCFMHYGMLCLLSCWYGAIDTDLDKFAFPSQVRCSIHYQQSKSANSQYNCFVHLN